MALNYVMAVAILACAIIAVIIVVVYRLFGYCYPDDEIFGENQEEC